jgi:hypothetical protein
MRRREQLKEMVTDNCRLNSGRTFLPIRSTKARVCKKARFGKPKEGLLMRNKLWRQSAPMGYVPAIGLSAPDPGGYGACTLPHSLFLGCRHKGKAMWRSLTFYLGRCDPFLLRVFLRCMSALSRYVQNRSSGYCAVMCAANQEWELL